MESLYLIVGLGNPGGDYARTRHNAGFLVVEQLADAWKAGWSLEKKFNARVAKSEWSGRKVLLVEPQTFMNLSGETVGVLMSFYRVPLSQMLVVADDADLPFGEIRLRGKGSSGGHHGLESIEQHVGSREFARLKIGIGRTVDGRREITGHVLGKFSVPENNLLEKVLHRSAAQAECWVNEGLEKAMNRFNGAVSPE